MRKIKYFIPIAILLLTIGFASANQTLSMGGNAVANSDKDDFSVYYSKALVNGEVNYSIIKSSTELDFSAVLDTVGTTYEVEYDITNSSAAFDAEITMTCTESNEYLEVVNNFDLTTPIPARGTRTGVLSLTKLKTNAGDEQSGTVSCDVTATPVERDSEGSGEVAIPIKNPYVVGAEIAIGEENFNIISTTDTTIKVLAQHGLSAEYKQSETPEEVKFSENTDWQLDSSSTLEIDIQKYTTSPKTYINEYVSYLQTQTGDTTLSGDLITLAELGNLGCSTSQDYVYDSSANGEDYTCTNSVHSNWVINGERYWTKSTVANSTIAFIWAISENGSIVTSRAVDQVNGNLTISAGTHVIRPVITLSKTANFELVN